MNGGQAQTQPVGKRRFTERPRCSASSARRSRILLVAATLAWPMIMAGSWTETETSLEVLPHVQKAGREVTLIAHVRGCDGGPATYGIVTFTVNGKPFKNVTLEGTRTAKLVTRDLPAGLLTIRAAYGFNNICSGSVSHPVHVLITTRAP